MSDRAPSHDLACEPDGLRWDGVAPLFDDQCGARYAWPSRPPPCPRCSELEAEIARVRLEAAALERKSSDLLRRVEELQAELARFGPLRNVDPAMRYRL